MTDDSKDALRAASFEPRAATQSTQEISDAPRPVGTWVALAIGAVLLGFVVFILPQLAPTPDSQSSAAPGTISEARRQPLHHPPVQRRRMPRNEAPLRKRSWPK